MYRVEQGDYGVIMTKKASHMGWLAAGLAVSGLAMTPAIARVIADNSEGVSLKSLGFDWFIYHGWSRSQAGSAIQAESA